MPRLTAYKPTLEVSRLLKRYLPYWVTLDFADFTSSNPVHFAIEVADDNPDTNNSDRLNLFNINGVAIDGQVAPAAVPVPGAVWLFGSGLALLGLQRKRG
jgi:hypothetical protein